MRQKIEIRDMEVSEIEKHMEAHQVRDRQALLKIDHLNGKIAKLRKQIERRKRKVDRLKSWLRVKRERKEYGQE